MVKGFATQVEAQQALIAGWDAARQAEPDKTHLILAYTRAEVQALNEQAGVAERPRENWVKNRSSRLTAASGSFAEQDRIYFLKNDRLIRGQKWIPRDD